MSAPIQHKYDAEKTLERAYDPASNTFGVTPVNSLVPSGYDYVAYTNTSSTVDTWVYKTGGSGGTLVATVTIIYVDSTKAQISSVAKT